MKNKIKKRLATHHHWRDIELNELVEIYITSFSRAVAWSMMGIFAPIYLYANDN
jgi:hypothetical protein